MTTSTCGKSRPLAATSVAKSIEGEIGVDIDEAKASRVRVRAVGDRFPCNECKPVLGRRKRSTCVAEQKKYI